MRGAARNESASREVMGTMNGGGYNDVVVLPQDLQDFAWSAPMRDLAKRVGVSDVGLKKILAAHGVAPPPQGYWNKLAAGKPVPRCPRVAARGPGETGRARLDQRFAGVLAGTESLPSSGPFASAAVPEDLEQLRVTEVAAIGRVTVPRKLERVHHSLSHLIAQEARRREKFAASRWTWDAPKFDEPVGQRRLRLLNALFTALSRRGHRADAYERDGEIHATAVVGHTRVSVDIRPVAERRQDGRGRGALPANLPAKTPLAVIVDGDQSQAWKDDEAGALEEKLVEVVAGTIVAGEAAFRRRLREAELRAEQSRAMEERRRRERSEALAAERLKRLRDSGELLRQAEDLRALLNRVRGAVLSGSLSVAAADLEAWETWARKEADRLDPVLSGQVMEHLLPPTEEH